MSRGNHSFLLFLVIVFMTTILYSCNAERLFNCRKVEDSNMVILEADFAGSYMDHWLNSSQIPYIILHYSLAFSPNDEGDPLFGSRQLFTDVYYFHRSWDMDEVGYWYAYKDTIVLAPVTKLLDYSQRVEVEEIRPEMFLKRLVVEGNNVRDVTVYPLDSLLAMAGHTVGYEGSYAITDYVVAKNGEILRKIIKTSMIEPTKNRFYKNNNEEGEYRISGF